MSPFENKVWYKKIQHSEKQACNKIQFWWKLVIFYIYTLDLVLIGTTISPTFIKIWWKIFINSQFLPLSDVFLYQSLLGNVEKNTFTDKGRISWCHIVFAVLNQKRTLFLHQEAGWPARFYFNELVNVMV